MNSRSLEGVRLKQHILLLVVGGYDETASLIISCLDDYDRLLTLQAECDFRNEELDLFKAVSEFHQHVARFEAEAERYDDLDECELESEQVTLRDIIREVGAEIETAIWAVSRQRSVTYHGLRAKLSVFQMCDDLRGSGNGILALRRSMWRDLDALLRKERQKPIKTIDADPG